MRDWTQALDGLVKLQAIVLAIENSPAKNGTHLYVVTDPLATANDLGASTTNHSSLSKGAPFGIKKSESNASQYPSPNQCQSLLCAYIKPQSAEAQCSEW